MVAEAGGHPTEAVDAPAGGRWFKPDAEDPPRRSWVPPSAPAEGSAPDTTWQATAEGESSWFHQSPSAGSAQASPAGTVGRSLHRLFRTYVGARALVGVLLALLHLGLGWAGAAPRGGGLFISLAYAAQALVVALWLLRWRPRRHLQGLPGGRQVALTVGVDVVAFLALMLLESGASFNFGALLVLPVLMAGVVLPRRAALATASAVTLALLAGAWWSTLQLPSGPSPWLASGLAGMGLLAMAWVSGDLAGRLLGEEQRALDSQERVRQQASLNRLVIEEMGEGVLVLNRWRRIMAANPAARSLLGLPPGDEALASWWASARAAWWPLLDAVERAHADGGWPSAGRQLGWGPGEAGPLKLRVRIRFTRLGAGPETTGSERAAEDLCVLLLEDERAVQARVQQEKLAAMGRVSAGMAHEIRNPLAAIAQATELLAEDRLHAPQQQLVSIMVENVQRLRRLVDDVLDTLPTHPDDGRSVDAAGLVSRVVMDWTRTARVSTGVVEVAVPAGGMPVLFDPEHLRRVLVNLLENAVRHSTGGAGSVRVSLDEVSAQEAVLTLSNDGLPILPEVEIHMFEPFFSTRSRGSGLGLYLCKELCERHGASIALARRPAPQVQRTAFEVRLRRPSGDDLDGSSRS